MKNIYMTPMVESKDLSAEFRFLDLSYSEDQEDITSITIDTEKDGDGQMVKETGVWDNEW